jgi:ectoine hydroxylase-related dioxygenase (phytanoyl-CoA dioxygenase family)
MAKHDLNALKQAYKCDGYITSVPIIEIDEAAEHRKAMEEAEARFGPLHYKTKVHTILRSPLALATNPAVLDIVEQLIGPDILLYNVTYIIKEAGTTSHVSWHQDLTYWGLSHDDQVSMWLALSPATEESGCMRMIPGSHVNGCVTHEPTDDDSNVLFRGQTVRGVKEENSVMCPLQPGEASFHHGWTLHASMPNNSGDRRIGLNVQYLATHVRQTKHDLDTAMLVRGEDKYRNFGENVAAEIDLDPAALAHQIELENRYVEIAGQA